MILEGYPCLYETHMHTRPGSACAHNSGAEMAKAAHLMGYAGIIITDHNWGGNTGISRALPWEQWVDSFTIGYREALEYGQKHDLNVFWGYEAGYRGTEFLIYGVTPDWLKAHPEIRNADVKEQYRLIHEGGGMVIHAHPFREAGYIPKIRLYPEYVDGVEGINAAHSSSGHKSSHYIHTTDLPGGGIAFRRRLTSVQDYCRAILGGEDYVLTNGDAVFDRKGNPVGSLL